MPGDPTPAERRERPIEVGHALTLLLGAARVDRVLMDAAHKVDRYVGEQEAAVRDLADENERLRATAERSTAAGYTFLAERDALREQVERQAAALREIAEYGGGDGGDWVECCDIARAALTEEPQPTRYRTISVGYVHVRTEPGGDCAADCPHPSHVMVAPEARP